jgi:sirohydrochlorin ferrochelatase
MKKTAEYQRHAEECRILARGAQNPQQRAQLVKMAETWEQLASERQRSAGSGIKREA